MKTFAMIGILSRWILTVGAVGLTQMAVGQLAPVRTTPAPPLPPTNVPTVRVIQPTSPRIRSMPGTPLRGTNRTIPTIPPMYRPLPAGMLAWDNETQQTSVKFGTPQAFTTFNLTNVSAEPVTITSVRTSCGCTTAKLPPMPWKLEPGTNGQINITMNLAGKRGKVIKTVTVSTDKGFKTVYVHTNIEEPPPGMMGQADRMRNLQIATANRQAVFRGGCASCHTTPTVNKMGAELFKTACSICHEADHRASMVPDLRNLDKETNADYWRTWITSSTDGKLMPAFAIEHGGILSAAQIESLVKYLVHDFPEEQPAQTVQAAPQTTH